jgi:hypothetical protein
MSALLEQYPSHPWSQIMIQEIKLKIYKNKIFPHETQHQCELRTMHATTHSQGVMWVTTSRNKDRYKIYRVHPVSYLIVSIRTGISHPIAIIHVGFYLVFIGNG